MRYLSRSFIFLVFLCHPGAIAQSCASEGTEKLTFPDCEKAFDELFSPFKKLPYRERAMNREMTGHPLNGLTSGTISIPSRTMVGDCILFLNSPPTATSSWSYLEDRFLHLLRVCVYGKNRGGVYEHRSFQFGVIHSVDVIAFEQQQEAARAEAALKVAQASDLSVGPLKPKSRASSSQNPPTGS